MNNNRRDFIKQLALATGGLMVASKGYSLDNQDKWGQILPLRKLGKTNENVTMLGVGGYHIGWTSEKDAQEVIEAAMEGGVRFFDTAESYQSGESERRYGKYLIPKYRDDIFLMTKSTAQNGQIARKHLEESLTRLKCDHVDLWQVHALGTPEDVDNRIKNEVLDVFEKAKEKGMVKHIGFTGHQNPFAHKRMLEQTKEKDILETIQMPINVIDSHFHSFIENTLSIALERNFGVIAMKTLSDGHFFKIKLMNGETKWTTEDPLVPEYISIKEALYFTWSLPVSVLVTGAENKELIKEKIELAKGFVQYSEKERKALIKKVSDKAGNIVEYYKKLES